MTNLIDEVKNLLEKDERVLSQVFVQRSVKSFSTILILTNKRIMYHRTGIYFGSKFNSIKLADVSGISYLPQVLHSGGILKIINNSGKSILVTPSFVGQAEADRFVNEVNKLLRK